MSNFSIVGSYFYIKIICDKIYVSLLLEPSGGWICSNSNSKVLCACGSLLVYGHPSLNTMNYLTILAIKNLIKDKASKELER